MNLHINIPSSSSLTRLVLFLSVSPLITSVIQGYNSTIFAYGVTGSGKTYTMSGEGDGHQHGVIPRSLSLLFDTIHQEAERQKDTIFMVTLSFVELYNDDFRGKSHEEEELVDNALRLI